MMRQPTIESSLVSAAKQLETCVASPHLDAELLLAFVLQTSRSYLRAWPEKIISPEQTALFTHLLDRRLQQEPLAYITGKKEFWSLEFTVTPHTLVPRPETELLIEMVLDLVGASPHLTLADLGTGSGAIALSLAHERPNWQIYATDISEKTLQIARKNAQQLRIENVSFLQGSWCTALPHLGFDVIVSNPPYLAETEWEQYASGLAFEPREALLSGLDGLDAIREISRNSKDYLRPGGYLLIEHGFQQGQAVRDLLLADQYVFVSTSKDLSGQERVTMGRR